MQLKANYDILTLMTECSGIAGTIKPIDQSRTEQDRTYILIMYLIFWNRTEQIRTEQVVY